MYSEAHEPPPAHDPRRSRWIPYAFFGFFGLVLAVNGILVVFALDSFNGLTEDEPYIQGLAYNQALDEYREERARGWRLGFAFDARRGLQSGELSIVAQDADGAPLSGGAMTATFVRPSSDAYDFAIALDEVSPGTYARQTELPLFGIWLVRVEFEHPDGHYRLEHSVQLHPPAEEPAGK